MNIHSVLAYNINWEEFVKKYSEELTELMQCLFEYHNIPKSSFFEIDKSNILDNRWVALLISYKWKYKKEGYIHWVDPQKYYYLEMGPVKNGLAAKVVGNSKFDLGRWLNIDVKYSVEGKKAKFPILFCPMEADLISRGSYSSRYVYFENIEEIMEVTPITFDAPFLIIGYNISKSYIVRINSARWKKVYRDDVSDNNTIERSIEFPPEYHQAGLGILNYFGTYLRDKYPEEEVKVRIEQEGLRVRLIIQPKGEKTEIIEKALHEYGLIILGKQSPESFIKNVKQVLRLENQLEIAQLQIRTEKRINDVLREDKEYLKDEVKYLREALGNGLTKEHNINVTVNPEINVSSINTINFQQKIEPIQNKLIELEGKIIDEEQGLVEDFEEAKKALVKAGNETEKENVKKSGVLLRVKNFLEKANDTGTTLGATVKKVKGAYSVLQDLAEEYNKIADWLVIPQVPKIFLKNKKGN